MKQNRNQLPWNIKTRYDKEEIVNINNIIEYIILAEFDIDTGSTVRIQCPHDIPYCSADWLAENMLPEGVHNRDEDWTYMFLNRQSDRIDHIYTAQHKNTSTTSSSSFLYGMNLVRNKKDCNVRRGAVVKAMAIFSKYPFIESFKAVLTSALEHYYLYPNTTILQEFYATVNQQLRPQTIPRPTKQEQLLMMRGVAYYPQCIANNSENHYKPQDWLYKTEIDMNFSKNPETEPKNLENLKNNSDSGNNTTNSNSNSALSFIIPLHLTAEEVGPINLCRTITLLREGIMRVYHAILTKQRVLFCGYNHSAMDIASIVFSCVSLALTPSTTYNLLSRVFPYANLSDLSFLEVSGYISGVTNPMFQNRYEWYDVLVLLDIPNDNCKVMTSNEKRVEDGQIVPNPTPPPLPLPLPLTSLPPLPPPIHTKSTPNPVSKNSTGSDDVSPSSSASVATVEVELEALVNVVGIQEDKGKSDNSNNKSNSNSNGNCNGNGGSPSNSPSNNTNKERNTHVDVDRNTNNTNAIKNKNAKIAKHQTQMLHTQAQAAQMQLAAKLHNEEMVAHESMDLRFITGLLSVLAAIELRYGAVITQAQIQSIPNPNPNSLPASLPLIYENISIESWIKQQFYNYSSSIVHQALYLLYASNKLVTKDLRRNSLRTAAGHCSIQQSYTISEKTRKMFAANGYRARLLADELSCNLNTSSNNSSNNHNESKITNTAGDGVMHYQECSTDVHVTSDFRHTKPDESEADPELEPESINTNNTGIGTGMHHPHVTSLEYSSHNSSGSNYTNANAHTHSNMNCNHGHAAEISTISNTISNAKRRHSFTEEFALDMEEKSSLNLNELTSDSQTQSQTSIQPNVNSAIYNQSSIEYILYIYIMRLRYESKLHSLLEVQYIYNYIYKHCDTEEMCQYLCSLLPDVSGGLSVLCNGLFNTNPNVRHITACICNRLSKYVSTQYMIESMNSYYASAYHRCLSQMDDGSLM